MSCIVTSPTGHKKIVKNLGWIARHRRDVVVVHYVLTASGGAKFTAALMDGTTYECEFADFDICRKFSTIKRFPAAEITSRSH